MGIRITASRNTIQKLVEKGHRFLKQGNKRGFIKCHALVLIFEGHLYKEISRILKITEETLRLWLRDFLHKGFKFLNCKKSPGRPSRLTKSQKRKLREIIKNGPQKYNFLGGCWRTPMIQLVIENEFNVLYSCHYISSLLRSMGFSYQKASFSLDGRDENKVEVWKKNIWPEILKEAKKKNSYVLFGDECSFSQAGSLTYTWAVKGCQPTIERSGSKKSYKVFGLIEYFSGNFFSMSTDDRLTSDSYISFLEMILSQTRKHLILIQDGASYHNSDQVETFFIEHSSRLSVYRLPARSPDLNPIEKLWKKMKEYGTHLKYFPTFDSLKNQVNETLLKFSKLHEEIFSIFGLYDRLSIFKEPRRIV